MPEVMLKDNSAGGGSAIKSASRRMTLKGAELRSFIEQAPVAIAMFDKEMRYVAVSPRWLSERKLDHSIIGRTAYEVYPDVDAKFRSMHLRVLAGETVCREEDHFEAAHGTVEWVRSEMRPWRDSDGEIGGVIVFAEDITAQKLATESLRRSEDRYRYAIEASTDGIWDWDLQTNTVTHSPAYYRMLGYEAADWETGNISLWTDLLHPDDREPIVAAAGELLRSEGHYQIEFRLRAKDNTYRWILSRARVVERDKSGAPIRAVGTHTDVTDRKLSAAASRQTSERLEMAQSAAHIGIWEWNLVTNQAFVNDQWLLIFGREEGSALSFQDFVDRLHPDDKENYLELVRRAFSGDGRIESECRIIRADSGAVRWIKSKGKVLFDKEHHPVRAMGAVWDITALKNAQEALLERSEARYRMIVETAQEGVWLLDSQAKTSFVNPTMANLLGYASEEMLGRHLLDFVDQEWKHIAEEKLIDRAAGIVETHDFKFRRKDGSELWALLSCKPIFEGNTFRGALAMVMDFTDRKRLEEEKLRYLEELKQSHQRKDEFLATLGHELRTPLATIKLAMDVIAGDETITEKFGALFARMHRQVKHLTRMVEDILQVSRMNRGKIELQKEKVDLNELLAQIADSQGAKFKEKGIRLNVNLPEKPLSISGDSIRLTQVFGNLLDNAAKYTDKDGTVDLAASRQANEAVLCIRDTGIGIPPEHITWIFELFNQMKNGPERAREGIGVGLALARKLVELHGGTIEAKSEGLGKGSEFIVRLPLELPRNCGTKS